MNAWNLWRDQINHHPCFNRQFFRRITCWKCWWCKRKSERREQTILATFREVGKKVTVPPPLLTAPGFLFFECWQLQLTRVVLNCRTVVFYSDGELMQRCKKKVVISEAVSMEELTLLGLVCLLCQQTWLTPKKHQLFSHPRVPWQGQKLCVYEAKHWKATPFLS